MTRATVLIAALSGRALAQSARRAGFEPLVADAFGDLDTVAAAAAYVGLPDAVRTGFRSAPLMAALDRLTSAAATEPVGLVLGSGFEDKPRLTAALSARFRLLGCGSESVARAKDPAQLFALLHRLQIAHPETRLEAPVHVEGWLIKRTGASGGAHIRDARAANLSSFPRRREPSSPGRDGEVRSEILSAPPRRADLSSRLRGDDGRGDDGRGDDGRGDDGGVFGSRNRDYFQRRIEGAPVSVLVVGRRDGIDLIGFSRQWMAGRGSRPFRYGGAVGPVRLAATIEDQIRRAVDLLVHELDLFGLMSFDFVERDGVAFLVDINPRPGATLDVFDDDQGSLFARHVEACASAPLRRGDLGPRLRGDDGEQDTGAGARVAAQLGTSGAMNAVPVRTAAVLYADQGPVEVGQVMWPEWASDRTAPGTRVPKERPIATVHATGATPDAAMLNCRARLDGLEDLIYRTATNKETRRDRPNASHDRTEPERLQARRPHR